MRNNWWTALMLAAAASAAAPGQEFSVIALPDTQNYSEEYPDIYFAQTQWCVDNLDSTWNVEFVTHLGDIVNEGETIYQWENAAAGDGRSRRGECALRDVRRQS